MNNRRNVIPILLAVVALTSWACTGAGIAKQSEDNIMEPATPDEGKHLREDALLQEDYLWHQTYQRPSLMQGRFRYRISVPEPLLLYPDDDFFSIDSMLLD